MKTFILIDQRTTGNINITIKRMQQTFAIENNKEHRFDMFVYGAAVRIISHTNVDVYFFVFFIFKT